MHISQLTVEAALASLHSRANGLDVSEAAARQVEFVHLFALILWAAAGLAFVAHHLHPGEGMDALGVAILGVIALNGVFSFWQVYQAERAFASLQQLLPAQATVTRGGVVQMLPAPEVVPGDILRPGRRGPRAHRLPPERGLRRPRSVSGPRSPTPS